MKNTKTTSMEKIKLLIVAILLLIFNFSCHSQRTSKMFEEEDREMALIKKAWSVANVKILNFETNSQEDNLFQLLDSLDKRGIDTILVFSIGTKNYKPTRHDYIFANYNGYSFSYELTRSSLKKRNYCTSAEQFIFKLYGDMINKDEHIVYDREKVNQYYYQDIVLYINREKYFSMSIRHKDYPDCEILRLVKDLNDDILECYYLKKEDVTTLEQID